MSAAAESMQASQAPKPPTWLSRMGPGLLVCVVVGGVAWTIAWGEKRAIDNAIVDALVVAMLLGILLRNTISLPGSLDAGAKFSSKQILEASVLLLGASVDLGAVFDAGGTLLGLIAFSVIGGITLAWVVGRSLGLHSKLAILIGVGNSICGNSAVAAVAPAIRASADDVAIAIGVSAVMGVGQILLLPLIVPGLSVTDYQYGVIAGISVYAVPQVVAAAFAVSNLSGQVATLVKLTRVLFLGPMILVLGFLHRKERVKGEATKTLYQRFSLFMPWFVGGFLILTLARTTGLINDDVSDLAKDISKVFFAVAMVGLGLGVDLKKVRAVGPRVAITILVSMSFMIIVSTGGTFIFDLRS